MLPTYYHTAMICMNGHVINLSADRNPFRNSDYCKECGEKTVTTCEKCSTPIRGVEHVNSIAGILSYNAPHYCHHCGQPYPWTEKKVMTAIQIFAEFGGLDEDTLKKTEDDLRNIAKDTPQSELSAMRIKRIWENGK